MAEGGCISARSSQSDVSTRAAELGQCVTLYRLNFEEVQRELKVWEEFCVFVSSRGKITSGFSRTTKIPKPDDVRQESDYTGSLEASQRVGELSLDAGFLTEKRKLRPLLFQTHTSVLFIILCARVSRRNWILEHLKAWFLLVIPQCIKMQMWLETLKELWLAWSQTGPVPADKPVSVS